MLTRTYKTLGDLTVHHFLPKSFELVVNMSDLLDACEAKNDADFEKRYGINRRRVAQLRDDNWLEVSRRDLQTLMVLEKRFGPLPYPLLSPMPHPFWETFDTLTNGYLAQDDKGDQQHPIDLMVLSKFMNARVPIRVTENSTDAPRAMQQQNCIFVGSPRQNFATELAIASLWPNGDAPFRFQRLDWLENQKRRDFHAVGPKGLHYRVLDDDKGEAQWRFAADLWEDKKNAPPPAGVLIVCRQPPGATRDVTTMIIAGCSAAGTHRAAQALLDGDVFAPPDSLKPGHPVVYAMLPNGKDGVKWYNRECDVAHHNIRTARGEAAASSPL